jgi:AbiU2
MTIIAADQRFAEALKIFETQVAETTQFWFAAATMNEVARHDTATLNALNLTPSFWITARVAMEYQAILTAAKIFGPRKTNPHNIDYLFQVVRETRAAAFSKDALEARKREGSANAVEWIGDYMKGVYVPTARDVNRLHELSKRHRKTYETQYADVRNLHVAHNVLVDANARWAMFQKTRIRDFEKLIVFLNQLHKVLWEVYYNGQRPALRPMPCSVRSLAAKKLKELRDGPTHEHIVADAETRMCMSLITRAAKALPKTSRRGLRWG